MGWLRGTLASLGVTVSVFALVVALAVTPARAQCPEVAVPPGVDVGAAAVEAVLQVDAWGRVAGSRAWEGPPALIAAVQARLPDCVLPGPAEARQTWVFPQAPINVAGRVRAAGDRTPVPQLQVMVGGRAATTDAQGRFALRNVAPGPAEIRVPTPRWRLAELIVDIPASGGLDVDLYVVAEERPNELVGLYSGGRSDAEVRRVDLEDARGIPGTLGDPLRVLAAQPGLARSPYDAGWLLVRGGDYDETAVYLDGVRTPLIYHLGGFTSVLHPEMISAVRFWPGLYPARYGDALSGAVDVVPRRIGDRKRVVGGVNLVFSHAFAEVPTAWGGVAVAARRSYLDAVLAPFVGSQAAGIAPRFWDVQARASIGKGSITVLGLSDAVDVPAFSGGGVLEIGQRALQAQAVVPLGRRVTLRPSLAWSRQQLTPPDIDLPSGIVGSSSAQQRNDHLVPALRAEAATAPGAQAEGQAGLHVQQRRTELLRSGDVVRGSTLSLDPYARLSMGDPVTAWTEVRARSALVVGQRLRTGIAPRAGVRWQATEGLQVSAAFGQVMQLPPPDLLLALAEGVYLDLERSRQWTAGLSLSRGDAAVRIDAYARDTDRLGEIERDGSVGSAQGRARGVEGSGRVRVGAFDGSALVQLGVATRQEDLDDPFEPSAFEQRQRAEVRGVLSLPRQWTLGTRARFNAGFPRTEVDGQRSPTEAYDLLRQRTVDLALPDDAERLAPYWSIDVRVERTFTFRTWRLIASLDVQNVTNRRVVEPVITGLGERQPAYGFGLPILPIFSVQGELFPGKPPS